MPPLLCASSAILDQSFPRDAQELNTVAVALGEIQRVLEEDAGHLLLTEDLKGIVDGFDWQRPRIDSLLIDVYRLLNQWFLQPHDRVVHLDVSSVVDYQPHPLPRGRMKEGLAEIWSDDVGRILTMHDKCCDAGTFFIGIACESAFAGGDKGEYDNPDGQRVFPLVGPDEITDLRDAYYWCGVPGDIRRKKVTISDFWKNCYLIGAESIENPSRGSHCKVKFSGGRSWPLDNNLDPIPDEFLRELVYITGLPLPVLKQALISGGLPNRALRFDLA